MRLAQRPLGQRMLSSPAQPASVRRVLRPVHCIRARQQGGLLSTLSFPAIGTSLPQRPLLTPARGLASSNAAPSSTPAQPALPCFASRPGTQLCQSQRLCWTTRLGSTACHATASDAGPTRSGARSRAFAARQLDPSGVSVSGRAAEAEVPETRNGYRRDSGGVSFYATCHPGLEQVVAEELRQLGYEGIEPSKAGVAFRGSAVSDGYAANLWLRSAIRVLVLLAEGELGADPRDGRRGGQALYDLVYDAAPWHELLPPGRSFSVEPRLWSCTDLRSTRLVWSRVKDAVCDSIRRHRPDKPEPPPRGCVADVPLHVSCYKDTVKVFRDMSGESLHRRGYRDVMHRAALNESAAAGVLSLAGWREMLAEAGDGEGLVLADPMCGSGTLLIEAALMARNIAPGLIRSLDLGAHAAPASPSTPAAGESTRGGRNSGGGGGGRLAAPLAAAAWPFQRWGDYDADAWGRAVDGARDAVRPAWRGTLLGVDCHEGALSLAVRQAKKAGVYGVMELANADCGSYTPPATPRLVVCNPPWGDRLSEASSRSPSPSGRSSPSADGGRRGRADRDGDRNGGGGGEWDEDGEGAGGGGAVESDAYVEAAWRGLDGFLYRHCPGASAFVISGNHDAFKYLKLKPSVKHRLTLSGVDVQVAGYNIRGAASRGTLSTADSATPPSETVPSSPSSSSSPSAQSPPDNQRSGEGEGGSAPPPKLRSVAPIDRAPHGVLLAGAAADRRARSRKATAPPQAPPEAVSYHSHADDGYWLQD